MKIATDMVAEGLITKEEAITPGGAQPARPVPSSDPRSPGERQGDRDGSPGLAGAASGRIVFTPEEAVIRGRDEKVILVGNETCPDDIHGMDAAQGILTARGG